MTPRAMTVEEMREAFIEEIRAKVDWWDQAKIDPASAASGGETRARLRGLAHSILAVLDGRSECPAFDLVPHPHPADEDYNRENDEDWWVGEDISTGDLCRLLYQSPDGKQVWE